MKDYNSNLQYLNLYFLFMLCTINGTLKHNVKFHTHMIYKTNFIYITNIQIQCAFIYTDNKYTTVQYLILKSKK